jgi:hypothetical protein
MATRATAALLLLVIAICPHAAAEQLRSPGRRLDAGYEMDEQYQAVPPGIGGQVRMPLYFFN